LAWTVQSFALEFMSMRARSRWKKKLSDESGNVLVLAALCMTLLLGFMGMAIDVGLLFRARRLMQTAADAAAISGSGEYHWGDMTAAAQAAAAQNGVTIPASAVNSPPLYGAYAGKPYYVEVIASQTQRNIFMGVLGFPSTTVSARAVAVLEPGSNCVYTLQSSPPSGSGISMTGGSTNVSIPNCDVIDDATGSTAISATGGAKLSARAISVVGTVFTSGGSTVSPAATTGIARVPDPLAFLTPPTAPGSCLADPKPSASSTLPNSSGIVCYSALTVSGGGITTTLSPGTYYFTGPVKVQGGATLKGPGVTLFFANSTATFTNSSSTLNLSAPTTGAYAGILFYQSPSDTATMTFQGGSGSSINGIFYVPNAQLLYTGGSGGTFNVDLVVGSLALSGGSTLHPYVFLGGGDPVSNPGLVE
jgi:Flp pilus assembly protein TadG